MAQILTVDQVAEYAREGFVIARGFFDVEEIDLLRLAAKECRIDCPKIGSFNRMDSGVAL